LAPPAPRLRRGLVHAAPYALCTLVGVLVGSLLRGSPAAPPAPVAAAPVAHEAPAAPVAPPAPAPAAPAEVEAPAAPAAVAPAGGDCVASVATEPADAAVVWGTQSLGRTPVQNARVPCGAATVVLRHERYRDVRRDVSATPGEPASVNERLKRPMGVLALSSTPARATFTVNQQEVGAGPRNVSVMRYEHLQVSASLPGYKPWSQTVYVKEANAKVVAQLVAIPKPAGRNLPAPARPTAQFRR
jgi:hypothetical protein